MSTVSYPHIEMRKNGRLYIAGTPFKVREIAKLHLAYGWSAEEIQRELPGLTLGQAYAALGYYYDHREELDREIAAGYALAEKMRAEQGESPLAAKLRAMGQELP